MDLFVSITGDSMDLTRSTPPLRSPGLSAFLSQTVEYVAVKGLRARETLSDWMGTANRSSAMLRNFNEQTILRNPSAASDECEESLPVPATIDELMIIHQPAHVLFAFWRDVENLPTLWRQLDDVQALDSRRSRWIATSPIRDSLIWEIEIFDERDDASIAWRSTGGDLSMTGRVSFNALTPLRTSMQVTIRFAGPEGELDLPLALLGEDFASRMVDELRSFKRAMETGGLLPAVDSA